MAQWLSGATAQRLMEYGIWFPSWEGSGVGLKIFAKLKVQNYIHY
jgi:hypothetical protein